MTQRKLRLGEPVEFTATLERVREWDKSTEKKIWKPVPRDRTPGLVIGKRTLTNGSTVADGDYYYYHFIGKERFSAFLVAYAMHRKPALVPVDHLHPVADRDQLDPSREVDPNQLTLEFEVNA